MKNKNQFKFKVFLTFIAFFAVIMLANAQIGTPGDVDDVPGAPIDGFIGVAIAAGAYFGTKKIRANKKEE